MRRLMLAILALTLALTAVPVHGTTEEQTTPAPAPADPGSYLLNPGSNILSRASAATDGVWSPDGSKLAVAPPDVDGAAGRLTIVDTRSGAATTMASPAAAGPFQMQWSPNGSRLAFGSPDSRGILIGDANGTTVHPVPDDAVARDIVVTNYAWTPDGRGITAIQFSPSAIETSFQIVTYDAQTGRPAAVVLPAPGSDCHRYLAWSPDGRYLAYGGTGFHEGCSDASLAGLYVWDARTAATTRLSTGPADPPVWAADGSILAEVAAPSSGIGPPDLSLHAFRPDGSGDRVLATGIAYNFVQPQPPYQSANGWSLYTYSDCDRSVVWTVDPSGAVRRLSDASVFALDAQLAPDGSAIAWVSVRPGGSDLVLVPLNGGPMRTVLRDAPGLDLAGWTRDGSALELSVTPAQRKPCADPPEMLPHAAQQAERTARVRPTLRR